MTFKSNNIEISFRNCHRFRTCSVSSRWSTQSWIINWIQEAAITLNCFPVSLYFFLASSFVATTIGSGFDSFDSCTYKKLSKFTIITGTKSYKNKSTNYYI